MQLMSFQERDETLQSSMRDRYQVDFDDFLCSLRTALDYVTEVSTVLDSGQGLHLQAMSIARSPAGHRSVAEDNVLSRAVDLFLEYDKLNLANLACSEPSLRRKQLHAEAHNLHPAAPSYEVAEHVIEIGIRPGRATAVPALFVFVGGVTAAKSGILKERRKLEWARALN